MEPVDLCVRNPQTHFKDEKNKYITYEIVIKTKNSCFVLPYSKIRRQFYEFVWLRKRLLNDYPYIKSPKFPPNLYFSDKFDPSYIAHRMKGLERFLQECIKIKNYNTDTTFHLFLQTDLPFLQLIDHADGKYHPTFMDKVWKLGGRTQPIAPDFWEQFEKDEDGNMST